MLRAPFPYYGYKGAVSEEVWRRLGNPPNYVEPFAGSLAVLLQRPGGAGKREVVNDRYGLVANFWRAVAADPATVERHAVWHASESDLHARNAACRGALAELTARLEGDPEYYDARLAGWWCFVQCLAIGECAFARGPWIVQDGRLVNSSSEDGIRRAVPCNFDRGLMGAGVQKSIPFHGQQGILAKTRSAGEWLQALSDRLQGVRVLCGDWSRACKPTYTTQHGLTGVFLDPPYDTDYKTYAHADSLLEQICQWCSDNGTDPNMRIILCGYHGTLPIDLVKQHGWAEYAWKSGGGRVTPGTASEQNRELERLWCSPHCLDSVGRSEQLSLLEELA